MKNLINKMGGRAFAVSLISLASTAVGLASTSRTIEDRHHFYVETNTATENCVLVYHQNHDGSLTLEEAVATGGNGNGGALGQGALSFGEDGRVLYAVNAGSHTLSVFAVDKDHLGLLQTIDTHGTSPISVTSFDDYVYVLNSGGVSNIQGFKWTWNKGLKTLEDSKRLLSTPAPSAEQVGFSKDGTKLVVTEKGTGLIDVFAVKDDGKPGPINTYVSKGAAPFGFAFGHRNTLVVSEAGTGTVSSYHALSSPAISLISGSVPTYQSAPCWAVTTHDGRFAYVADAGSGQITGYSIEENGTLSLLIGNGANGTTDPHPIDMAVSGNDDFLYVDSNNGGAVDIFAIGVDGSLLPLGSVTGLPTSISGALTD